MVTYYSRSGLSLSHVSLIVTTTKWYSVIVASNSSNEDAMLCALMWNIRSWCDLSWNTWRCSSTKSGSSASGSLIQLVSESDKSCLWKGKTLIVHLGHTHSFEVDDDLYFGLKTFEHFAWVTSKHVAQMHCLWFFATGFSHWEYQGAAYFRGGGLGLGAISPLSSRIGVWVIQTPTTQ